MSETKRVKWLDCTKGLAAILVVAGHIANGYLGADIYTDYTRFMTILYNTIYAFHMPLFFMLSGFSFGYAYIEKETDQLRKKQVKLQTANIIVLYIAWNIILWLFKSIFSEYVVIQYSINDLLWIPLKSNNLYWYFYVLALCYLVTYLLMTRKLNHKYILLSSAILCLAQYWLTGAASITAITTISYYFYYL